MADPATNHASGVRHAPAPNIQPMGQDQVGGTSGIINSAARSKPGKSAPAGMPKAGQLSGPLRLSSIGEILGAAKLGQRPPQQKTPGEQGSDAEEPNQAVESLPDGSFVHHRRMSNGTVNSNPIGSGPTLDAYENLQHDSMPANVGELQQRLGVPDLFGNEA